MNALRVCMWWCTLRLVPAAAATLAGPIAAGSSSPAPARWALPAAPKQHVERVEAGTHRYEVSVGGMLDEFNTACYPETYGGSMRLESKFQPNQYVLLENVGEVEVINPRLVVNGRRDWFSADDILAGVLKPGMTEAEKAIAIWGFCASMEVQAHDNNRRVGPAFPASGSETDNDQPSHPSRNTFQERANPVKAVNCYYCSGCSLSAANFVILCRHAGLIARAPWMSSLNTFRNHCVGEVWYDGDWHLYDPELRAFFLEADNTTVASYEDLHRNPELERRTHNGGFAGKGMAPHAGEYKKYFPPHLMPVEPWLSTMAMTLRPGESFVWRWAHDGKYRYGENVRKKGHLLPYHLANGKFIYRPKLGGDAYLRSIVSDHNIAGTAGGDRGTRLHPQVVSAPGDEKTPIAAPPGFVIYKVCSPYPIVGGLVGGRFRRKTPQDGCSIYVSVHDSDWRRVFSADKTGEFEAHITLDEIMNPRDTPAIYAYYVKFELQAVGSPADAWMTGLYLETDVQMADTAMPSLSGGANRAVYRDESKPGRRVRIVHGWRESAATRPPKPPAAPKSPADGAEVDLAGLKTLAWQPASDPDGEAIADHHVQVSPREDMLHPVSPNFDRLVPSGTPQWPLPEGWFVKGRTYYWRVRARDAWGAWSDWSRVWRFVVKH